MVPAYFIYAFFGVWLLTITVLLIKMMTHYNHLTANVSKKDLISSLNHLISVSGQNTDSIKNLEESFAKEVLENKNHLQKIGFQRYNPFTDTGGDQSFSMALLDDNGDGIMISSLHSRENTRLYAKQVVSGKVPDQALSKEETQVIKEALK